MIHERDRRTDGRTDGQTRDSIDRACIALRGKNVSAKGVQRAQGPMVAEYFELFLIIIIIFLS